MPRRLIALMIIGLVSAGVVTPAGANSIVAFGGNGTPAFWVFDTSLRRWSVLPDAPFPVTAGAALATKNSDVYALRGGGTNEFWRFRSNVWTRLADTPGAVMDGAAVVGLNFNGSPQTLYALQGGGSLELWKYDIPSDIWSHRSTTPVPANAGSALAVSNIGFGGTLDVLPGGQSAVWAFDLQSDVWSSIQALAQSIGPGGAIVNTRTGCDLGLLGHNTQAVIATGAGCGSKGSLPPLPVAATGGAALTAAALSFDNDVDSVYAFNGGTAGFWRYGIQQAAWSSLADAPAPVGPGAALAEILPNVDFGVPTGPPAPLPIVTSPAIMTIDQPRLTFARFTFSGLPPSQSFCFSMGGVNYGCSFTTNASGGYVGSFGIAISQAAPRQYTLVFGPQTYSAIQTTDMVSPQDIALAPGGSLHFDNAFFNETLTGTNFPVGCESSSVSALLSGIPPITSGMASLIPTFVPNWSRIGGFSGNWDAVTTFLWRGEGSCFGLVLSGANPGGTFPRTIVMDDASSGASASASATSLNFGAVGVNLTSSLPVTIQNVGTGVLVVRDVAVIGPDAIQFRGSLSLCSGVVLLAGQSCAAGAIFRPTLLGSKTATLVITPNAGAQISIPLSGDSVPAIGRYSGTVTDAVTGQPIPNVTVTAYTPAGVSVASTITNASGQYVTTDLSAGQYVTKATAGPGYVDKVYQTINCVLGCDVRQGKQITVVTATTLPGIDFALLPDGAITGTVTNSAPSALSGIGVAIYDLVGTLVRSTSTDGSGHYAASGLVGGTYFARTMNAQGYSDVLYQNFACALGCDVTTGTAISTAQGVVAHADFVLPDNTLPGVNVGVLPPDPVSGTTPLAVTFNQVTSPGQTALTISTSGTPPPTGYALGTPPTYFDVTTTATFTPPIAVCISYAGMTFSDPSQIRLLHEDVPGVWVDVTTSLNQVTQVVCGQTQHLSNFTIAEATNQAPVCAVAAPSVTELWPPDHRIVPVGITNVTDPEGGPVAITITSIFQDELTNNENIATTSVDGGFAGVCSPVLGVSCAPGVAYVRAERGTPKPPPSNGRVYHVHFTATDALGASCSGQVTVKAPPTQGGTAIDGGAIYDSTIARRQ